MPHNKRRYGSSCWRGAVQMVGLLFSAGAGATSLPLCGEQGGPCGPTYAAPLRLCLSQSSVSTGARGAAPASASYTFFLFFLPRARSQTVLPFSVVSAMAAAPRSSTSTPAWRARSSPSSSVLPDRQGRVQLAMSLLPKATDKGARITASMLTATRSTTASVSCLVMRASGDPGIRGKAHRIHSRFSPSATRTHPPRHRELRHPRRVCSPPTTNEEGSVTPSSSPTTALALQARVRTRT